MSDPAAGLPEDDFDPTANEELSDSESEISLEDIVHSLARLLPDGQELHWFDADFSAVQALALLQRAGYSQAPVRHGRRYLGVFSYRSFAHAVTVIGASGPLDELTVSDCLEQLPLASMNDKIDDIFEALDRFDAVLVGARRDIRGIVSVMDTLRYFFELANAYVLMQQIELGLRHAIRICVDQQTLAECIERAVARKYESSGRKPPEHLRRHGSERSGIDDHEPSYSEPLHPRFRRQYCRRKELARTFASHPQ